MSRLPTCSFQSFFTLRNFIAQRLCQSFTQKMTKIGGQGLGYEVAWSTLALMVLIQNGFGQETGAETRVLSYENVNNGAEGYHFGYTLSDGTARREYASFENGVWTVRGVLAWVAPDGQSFQYTYKADDKGTVWTPAMFAPAAPSGGLSAPALSSLAGVG